MALPVNKPKAMLADERYDSDTVRSNLLMRGILPIIPPKSNRREPIACDFRRHRNYRTRRLPFAALVVVIAPSERPEDARPVTAQTKRGIAGFTWAGDDRTVLFSQDSDGVEYKQRVKLPKGVWALYCGFAMPSGILNLVTK